MALEGDGTVQGIGDTQNIQFYVPKNVSTDSKCVFSPRDPFKVRIIPHTGLLLTPPDVDVTLADVLASLDVRYPTTDMSFPDEYDPRNISL